MPKVVMFRQKGDFRRTSDFLKRANRLNLDVILNQYGQEGVEALRAATPKDTGTTANSWSYAVHKGTGSITITWSNSNIVDGVPIAVFCNTDMAPETAGMCREQTISIRR